MRKWLKKKKLLKFFDKYQNLLQGLVAVVVIIAALFGAGKLMFSNQDSPPAQPMITMTLEQFEDLLKAKIEEALVERASTNSESQMLLDLQIETLQDRLANSEEAFEVEKQTIISLQEALNNATPLLGSDAVAKANAALAEGDTALAEALFSDINARAQASVQASASASFALGKIAEQDIRWQESYSHYSDAARLQPSYDHLILAQKMAHNLAIYTEAELLGNAALAAADHEFGYDSPQYGTALNNLASLLQATGRFEEAEPLKRQALENTRAALGEDHPTFGIHLNNLAKLLEATGRFEEAEPLYRQAVEVLEKALGPDHPSTQTVKANFEQFLANRPPAD
ncbi:MAG TPA: tetratricopeptide repeat protein [Rhodobacteraceae bacterium]|nr:tetratricopeptide repeat protein [Paracoccaceae bacterium]